MQRRSHNTMHIIDNCGTAAEPGPTEIVRDTSVKTAEAIRSKDGQTAQRTNPYDGFQDDGHEEIKSVQR